MSAPLRLALGLQQLPLLQQHISLLSCCSPWPTCNKSYARLPDSQASNQAIQQARQQQLLQQQQHRQQQRPYPKLSDDAPLQKLYKGKWIIPVRFLVRAKVFQLLGGGSIGVLLGTLTMQEASWLDIMALTGLAGGMVAASCCLWYYSRRYVGEMSLLLPERQHVRLSVLDFWGNREDNDIPLSALQTFKGVRPKEVSRVVHQLLFPVNVSGDRQYYFNSIAEANIIEPEIFFSILKGDFDPLAANQQDAAGSSKEQQQQQQAASEEQQLSDSRQQQG